MKKQDTKTVLYSLIVSMTVGTFFIGFSYIHAQWQGPTAPPPGNNVPAPINVGPASQVKTGPIGAGAFSTPYRAADRDGNAVTLRGGPHNSQLLINATHESALDTEGFGFRLFHNTPVGQNTNVLRFEGSGGQAQARLVAGVNPQWYQAMNVFGDGRIGVRFICDINGQNCVNFDRGLQYETQRFFYQRQGREPVTQRNSAEPVPNPASGPGWDSCTLVASAITPVDWQNTRCIQTSEGERCETAGFLHSNDRNVTPLEWIQRLQQAGGNARAGTPPGADPSSSAAVSRLRGGPECGTFRSEGRWYIRLSLGDSQYSGNCSVECRRLRFDNPRF